jgi:hypothetical protein
VLVTAGEVIEQLFGAFISWHTCTLKSRRRITAPRGVGEAAASAPWSARQFMTQSTFAIRNKKSPYG